MKTNYVRISQMLLDFENVPMTLPAMMALAEDLNKKDRLTLHEEEPAANWGTAVYRVNEDGSLTMTKHKLDTSG